MILFCLTNNLKRKGKKRNAERSLTSLRGVSRIKVLTKLGTQDKDKRIVPRKLSAVKFTNSAM